MDIHRDDQPFEDLSRHWVPPQPSYGPPREYTMLPPAPENPSPKFKDGDLVTLDGKIPNRLVILHSAYIVHQSEKYDRAEWMYAFQMTPNSPVLFWISECHLLSYPGAMRFRAMREAI